MKFKTHAKTVKFRLAFAFCLSYLTLCFNFQAFGQEFVEKTYNKEDIEQVIELKLPDKNHFLEISDEKRDENADPEENQNLLEPSVQQATISNYATRNWFGLRDELKKHGISPIINYMNNDFQKLYGGKNPSNKPVAQGLTSIALDLNMEKLVHWKGGEIYTLFQNSTGASIDQDYVGDVQGLNNFDTREITELTEYWVQQSFFNNKLKIKFGKQDANLDLAVIAPGTQFMNFGFSSTKTIPIPTFPTTSGGISAIIEPNKVFAFRAGWFRSLNPEKSTEIGDLFSTKGHFTVAEVNLFPPYRHFQGKQVYGIWVDTSTINNLANEGTSSSNFGVYAGFHPLIYKENNIKDDKQGLTIDTHFGWAPQDKNVVTRTYAFGVSYRGLITKRDEDVTGIGTAIATLSKHLEGARNEAAIETFYLFQLKPWLFIQPDFQIIFHPGGIYKNAYVLGLRTVLTL